MNTISKKDWSDYASYLQSQIEGKDLKNPKSIGESYNNFTTNQDLEEVNRKIYVKTQA